QRRIEAELKEAYDIINKSPAVVFLWKNQKGWPVEFVSDNVEALFGYTSEEFISGAFPYSETVHPDDLDRVAEDFASYSAAKGKKRFSHIPYRIVRKDGEVKWVDNRTYVRGDDYGNITHYQGIVLDVTASREAEEALKESEEKFRNLAEQSPNMIFISKQGNVVYANKRCEEVLGYKREQFYRPDFGFFSLIAPESRETIKTILKEHMAGKEVEPYEYSIIDKDGKRIDAINTTKWIDYGGDRALLGIVTDISERKQLEREREGLIAELEAKNAELERFTYTVSHDLKSPLITIRGFLGLLESDIARGDTEKLKIDMKRISNATDQMKALLDELLELSRVGRLISPPEEISLEHLARDTMESLSGIINNKGVTVHISPDLPVICGDRMRLAEVYQNMMENAVKFMGDQPKPHIQIGARQDRGETVFYVKDNGMGIDSRYQKKIFGLFEKLDSEVEGTGVGLALSQRIIELHGGRIWVESEGLGKGSTFCFTLPVESQRR
ncbi:MAG: PAS domain S-box protein, partial [Desulfobacterales bacterium]